MSDLEKRVQVLESYLQADSAFLPYGQLEKCITDLEERLSSLASCQAAALDRVFTEAKRVTDLEAWGAFLDGFSRGTEARFDEVEGKIKRLDHIVDQQHDMIAVLNRQFTTLEGIIKTYFDEAPSKRIHELEAKVESLTRTLDMLQDIMGIEVVVTAQTHEGVCEKCDRVGELNTENMCEGCFYEEIGVGDV